MGRKPDPDQLKHVAALPLSYPDEGATAGVRPPAGYRAFERTQTLGTGAQTYERAGAGLLAWQMHRRAGFQVVASAPTAIPGSCAILVLGRWPLVVTARCRVVYGVESERRCGFAYGTLLGHPESGEESFVVTHEDDDRVTFTIRAFSRPASLPARAAGPLAHLAQHLVTTRYLRALRSIAAG